MPVLSTGALSLHDWAKRLDPDGKVPTIVELYPAESENVGFFALPVDNDENPLTTWLSSGIYASADTDRPDSSLRFM